MKIRHVILILVFSCNVSAFAMLPPLYHSIREYEAILRSEELAEYLGSGRAIEEIRRVPSGSYLVFAQDRVLMVDVIYQKQEKLIGPGVFELKFRLLN